MFHTESGERSAAQELMALHIDMSIRRVAQFPPEKYAALQVGGEIRPGDPAEGRRKKDRIAGLAAMCRILVPFICAKPLTISLFKYPRERERQRASRVARSEAECHLRSCGGLKSAAVEDDLATISSRAVS